MIRRSHAQDVPAQPMQPHGSPPGALNPALQGVLNVLDVRLEEELALYRRRRRETNAPRNVVYRPLTQPTGATVAKSPELLSVNGNQGQTGTVAARPAANPTQSAVTYRSGIPSSVLEATATQTPKARPVMPSTLSRMTAVSRHPLDESLVEPAEPAIAPAAPVSAPPTATPLTSRVTPAAPASPPVAPSVPPTVTSSPAIAATAASAAASTVQPSPAATQPPASRRVEPSGSVGQTNGVNGGGIGLGDRPSTLPTPSITEPGSDAEPVDAPPDQSATEQPVTTTASPSVQPRSPIPDELALDPQTDKLFQLAQMDPPDDYLESSEELLRSLADEPSAADQEEESRDRGLVSSLFTPLGVGSFVLLLLSTAALGYVFVNPDMLNYLSSLWPSHESKPSETVVTPEPSASVEPAPVPTTPNLAAQEFKELDLNTLSTLNNSANRQPGQPGVGATPGAGVPGTGTTMMGPALPTVPGGVAAANSAASAANGAANPGGVPAPTNSGLLSSLSNSLASRPNAPQANLPAASAPVVPPPAVAPVRPAVPAPPVPQRSQQSTARPSSQTTAQPPRRRPASNPPIPTYRPPVRSSGGSSSAARPARPPAVVAPPPQTVTPPPPAPAPAPVAAQPAAPSGNLYYVVTDYNSDRTLDAAQKVNPQAYVRNFDDGAKIQFGAFTDESKAQSLVQELQNQGIPAQVKPK